MNKYLIIAALVLPGIMACQNAAWETKPMEPIPVIVVNQPTPTPIPDSPDHCHSCNVTPTPTPCPTATPKPTATPRPTATPVPTPCSYITVEQCAHMVCGLSTKELKALRSEIKKGNRVVVYKGHALLLTPMCTDFILH